MPLQKLKSDTFFGSSALIFLSRAFVSLAGLAVVILYSGALSEDDYGSYSNFWVHVNVFYPLACIGVHVWLMTYSSQFLRQVLEGLKAAQYISYAVWVCLVSAAFAFFESKVSNIGFILSLIFVLTYVIGIVAESILIISRSYKTFLSANFIYALLYWVAHVYVVQSGFSLDKIFLFLCCVNTIKIIISFLAIVAWFRQDAGPVTGNAIAARDVKKLWVHMGVYDITQSLSGWIDKFIVSLALPLAASAVYFNGTMNIPFLPILVSAAGSAALLQLAGGDEVNERNRAVELMNRSGRMLSCVVYPIFFFLLFFNREVIDVVLPKYKDSIPVFVISLLILPIRAYSFTSVLQRMHKGHIINIGAIGEIIIALCIMYPLYQLMGLPGVALSFIISCYLQVIYYMYHYTRLLHADVGDLMPFRNWMIKAVVFGFLFTGLHNMLSGLVTEKISVFLGCAAMILSVLVSLGLELKTGNS